MRSEKAELWMLGHGKLEKKLKAESKQLGIQDRVRWFGFQENPFPFVREADCFALSSNWEGLPNVLIESLACGTPIVSTDCPYGPNEVIQEGISGFLVPMNDEEAFSSALTKLARDASLRGRMAEAGRRYVFKTFQQDHICRLYENLFEQLAR